MTLISFLYRPYISSARRHREILIDINILFILYFLSHISWYTFESLLAPVQNNYSNLRSSITTSHLGHETKTSLFMRQYFAHKFKLIKITDLNLVLCVCFYFVKARFSVSAAYKLCQNKTSSNELGILKLKQNEARTHGCYEHIRKKLVLK